MAELEATGTKGPPNKSLAKYILHNIKWEWVVKIVLLAKTFLKYKHVAIPAIHFVIDVYIIASHTYMLVGTYYSIAFKALYTILFLMKQELGNKIKSRTDIIV